MNEKKNNMILFGANFVIFTFLILYFKFSDFGIMNKDMLSNIKYTIGIVSTDRYFNKGSGIGYDYKFYNQERLMTAHEDGNLIRFRKYLVVYDSLNIKNGFMILDNHDVTDSLKNRNIDETEGWSIDKLPFEFNKKMLNEEVKEIVMRITK